MIYGFMNVSAETWNSANVLAYNLTMYFHGVILTRTRDL